MGIVFVLSEDTAEDWLNAKREKHAGAETGGIDFLRLCASGELIAGGDVAAQGGKGSGRARVRCDLMSSDGNDRTTSQVISQQNKSLGIIERKRAEQDAFDEREDGGGGTDAHGKGEDDGEGEAGCLAQLTKCESEILCERVHASSVPLGFVSRPRSQD